jgi:hypothetical protein
MEQCSSVNNRGRRCCKKTANMYECYGVDLPLCHHHKDTNPIFVWSYIGDYSAASEKVVRWLDFFNDIIGKSDVPPWLAVYITTKLYEKVPSDTSQYDLMNCFFNSVLLPCDPVECPVCMTNDDTCVTTPCGHSYCRGCIVRWMHSSVHCPLCRKIIC